MNTRERIIKQTQCVARCENSLALEKLKKRRADTRRKIELGGLVIKAGMDGFNKSLILGAVAHAMQLIEQDEAYIMLFQANGDKLFLNTQDDIN